MDVEKNSEESLCSYIGCDFSFSFSFSFSFFNFNFSFISQSISSTNFFLFLSTEHFAITVLNSCQSVSRFIYSL